MTDGIDRRGAFGKAPRQNRIPGRIRRLSIWMVFWGVLTILAGVLHRGSRMLAVQRRFAEKSPPEMPVGALKATVSKQAGLEDWQGVSREGASKIESKSQESRLAEIEKQWSSEPVDLGWAAHVEEVVDKKLRSVQATGIVLESIDCRTTLCKLIFSQTDDNVGSDFAARLPNAIGVFSHMTAYGPQGPGRLIAYGFKQN